MRTPVQLPDVAETESKLGGRGPEVPPGGRDGDGGDHHRDQPQGTPGPYDRLRRFRVGLGLGVVSIYVIFIALTSAYVIRQGTGHVDSQKGIFVRDWKPLVIPQILWLNTGLLLISSVSAEVARRAVFHEEAVMEEWLGIQPATKKRALPWMAITLVLGLGFLAGQVIAWKQLVGQGFLLPSNPSHAFFFILTGGHALHLLGGIFGLLWASLSPAMNMRLQSRQIVVDISAWYWHAMGVLWIYIFTLFHVAR